jgi:hypothetical protein
MLKYVYAHNFNGSLKCEVLIVFKQSITLGLLVLSLGGLASCKGGEDKPNAAITTGANNGKLATGAVPIGTKINTDLQQEISSGKNKKNDKFTIKIQNGSVSKYPALKDAVIQGHLESAIKAAKGKKAQLDLVFDAVKLKSGELVPIEAELVNTQIESKTKGKFLQNVGIILGGTVAGNFVGDKANFKHGKMAGAAAATAFVLSSPGGEVVLKKGTDIQLKLKANLDPN